MKKTDFMVHELAGYSNPQTMKVGGLLKQQPITILIDMGSTNNFLNSKVAAHMALHIEDRSPYMASAEATSPPANGHRGSANGQPAGGGAHRGVACRHRARPPMRCRPCTGRSPMARSPTACAGVASAA
ncbi:hypothetical protein BHE74_00010007 [Ensete ventricosum]|nr:hypothetical protein BHE74_00010007 [Ensete ventricosum]